MAIGNGKNGMPLYRTPGSEAFLESLKPDHS
jgi:hypothetical protein